MMSGLVQTSINRAEPKMMKRSSMIPMETLRLGKLLFPTAFSQQRA